MSIIKFILTIVFQKQPTLEIEYPTFNRLLGMELNGLQNYNVNIFTLVSQHDIHFKTNNYKETYVNLLQIIHDVMAI